ncbi:S1 family peptidase [Actinacidiphila sp. bgisy160]|uniref:S1 family peptidase n=1 Tax=Actinacidiphila sp. bgisy160 TaxID=3413796 RepID=UPI003D745795
MKHKQIAKREIVFVMAGAAAIAAAAVLLPSANASQSAAQGPDASSPKRFTAAAAAELASRLGSEFGPSVAGAYYDAASGRLVVNVVAGDGDDVAARAREAGAATRTVENSAAELTSAAQTLKQRATIPGTAWAVDPRTNRILVTADRTVAGAKWDTLESTVRSLGGGMARLRKSAGEFKPLVAGGDAIFAAGARCSLGFNVVKDGAPAFLTAGHCGVAFANWSDSQGGAPVATVRQATFPGDGDFALVTYDDPNTQAPSQVNLGNGQALAVKGAAEAAVGQEVFRMGSTTGLHGGTVLGLDATVNYPEGTVTGLLQTDVCAEPGDSGGALFTRDGSAIGLTSGGSGDCQAGGETFFQPVTTALAAVGARLG